jgi:hypothetical protein
MEEEDIVDIRFEDTELYALIGRATRVSLRMAWKIAGVLSDKQLQVRSAIDQSTFLHHVVNQV